MAKKSRRVRRRGAQTRLSEAQMVQPTQAAKEAPPATEAAVTQQPSQTDEFSLQEEYRYVVTDLERLGVLAAVILGGMLLLFLVV